jgi:hypothetical protein
MFGWLKRKKPRPPTKQPISNWLDVTLPDAIGGQEARRFNVTGTIGAGLTGSCEGSSMVRLITPCQCREPDKFWAIWRRMNWGRKLHWKSGKPFEPGGSRGS